MSMAVSDSSVAYRKLFTDCDKRRTCALIYACMSPCRRVWIKGSTRIPMIMTNPVRILKRSHKRTPIFDFESGIDQNRPLIGKYLLGRLAAGNSPSPVFGYRLPVVSCPLSGYQELEPCGVKERRPPVGMEVYDVSVDLSARLARSKDKA